MWACEQYNEIQRYLKHCTLLCEVKSLLAQSASLSDSQAKPSQATASLVIHLKIRLCGTAATMWSAEAGRAFPTAPTKTPQLGLTWTLIRIKHVIQIIPVNIHPCRDAVCVYYRKTGVPCTSWLSALKDKVVSYLNCLSQWIIKC